MAILYYSPCYPILAINCDYYESERANLFRLTIGCCVYIPLSCILLYSISIRLEIAFRGPYVPFYPKFLSRKTSIEFLERMRLFCEQKSSSRMFMLLYFLIVCLLNRQFRKALWVEVCFGVVRSTRFLMAAMITLFVYVLRNLSAVSSQT